MFITWLSVWETANKCRISDLTVIWQVITFSNTDYPSKKKPGIPRNCGVKFLAFLAFLHIRKSQEKARKSQECPGPPGFPGVPRKARRAWKENFLFFRAFPYVQKSPELLTRMIAGTPWLFLDSGVSWKAWKSQEKPGKIKRKFPRFPGFSLCAKKKARSFWLEWFLAHPGFSLIPGFPGKPGKTWKSQEKIYHMALLAPPWLRGYLESLEKPREDLPHCTLGSSLIAGFPKKHGKARRRPSGS